MISSPFCKDVVYIIKKIISKFEENSGTIIWCMKEAWKIGKSMLIFWIIVSILIALLPYYTMKLTQQVTDSITHAAGTGDKFSLVAVRIIILALLMAFTMLFGRFTTVMNNIMYNRYSNGMQEKLMDSLRGIPLRLFDKADFMADLNAIRGTLNRLAYFITYCCNTIGAVITLISMLVLAFSVSWMLFITAVIITIYTSVRSIIRTHKSYKSWDKDREDYNKLSYWTGIPSNNITTREIRVLQIRRYVLSKYDEYAEKLKKNEAERANMYTKLNIEGTIVYNVFRCVFLSISLLDLSKGRITAGEVVLINTMLGQIYSSTSKMAQNLFNAGNYLEVLGKQMKYFTSDWLKEKEPMDTPYISDGLGGDTVFELDNVSYEYIEGVEVLNNINLQIKKGEVIALVGENGSGKSTLVKLLLGLYPPTAGEMRFWGKSYKELSRQDFSDRVGVSFQDYVNYPLQIRNAIGFGNIVHMDNDEIILRAMKKGGSSGLLNDKKDGLSNYLTRRFHPEGIMPSGGQWQRIAVSRAHMFDKEIMIMDEPAAALDPIAEMQQFYELRDMLDGRTAILISHRIGFARLADRIIVLSKGEIAEEGTHAELIAKNGLYADYFSKQAEWYDTENII